MDLIGINQGLEQIALQIDKVMKQYHEAKTKYDNIDEMKKVMLAFYSMKYEGSEAYVSRQAQADEDYREYIKGLNTARGEYNRVWALLKALEIKLSTYQSLAKTYQMDNRL
jgi:hypothetical protein